MLNKRKTKTSLTDIKYAFMATAIAFVLVMGTVYSPMQSSGLDYNGIGNLEMYNGLTQSAECAGLGQDCSEDNRVTNPTPEPTPEPEPEPPTPVGECELCLAELTDEQEAALLAVLGVDTIAEACALVDIDETALLVLLELRGIPFNVIEHIIGCLGLG